MLTKNNSTMLIRVDYKTINGDIRTVKTPYITSVAGFLHEHNKAIKEHPITAWQMLNISETKKRFEYHIKGKDKGYFILFGDTEVAKEVPPFKKIQCTCKNDLYHPCNKVLADIHVDLLGTKCDCGDGYYIMYLNEDGNQ